jgi:hypothetical protein
VCFALDSILLAKALSDFSGTEVDGTVVAAPVVTMKTSVPIGSV